MQKEPEEQESAVICGCGKPLPQSVVTEGKTRVFSDICGPLGGWHRPVVNCPSCGAYIYFAELGEQDPKKIEQCPEHRFERIGSHFECRCGFILHNICMGGNGEGPLRCGCGYLAKEANDAKTA